MRIAVAAEKDSVDSMVSDRAGRAPYYLVFDGKNLVKSIKNPFAVGGGGAGFGVVQMLFNEGVEMIVSAKFGNNMLSAINNKGLSYKEVSGRSVKEVVDEIFAE